MCTARAPNPNPSPNPNPNQGRRLRRRQEGDEGLAVRAAPQREVVGEAAQEGGQRAELVRDVLERRARAEGHLPCARRGVSEGRAGAGRGVGEVVAATACSLHAHCVSTA